MLIAALILSCLLAQDESDVTTEDKVRIRLTYFKPAVKEGEKRACVILVHMLNRTREDWKAFAESLKKEGYCVVTYDIRNHGNSGKKDPGDPIKMSKQDWMAALKDIKAIKEWLAPRAECDVKRLAVIGASIGGALAAHYAAGDADVKAVGLLSPANNPQRLETLTAMERIAERAIFAAAAEDDKPYPDIVKRIRAAALTATVKLYTRGGHGTRMFGNEDTPGDLAKSLLAWIKENVKP